MDANLRSAKLVGANLTYAILTGADLTGADLEGASLVDANFRGATIYGAAFGGARGIDRARELEEALGYDEAIGRPLFRPESGGDLTV